MLGCQLLDTVHLLVGIARWHIRHRLVADVRQHVEQLVEVAVLELLPLLVAGDAVTDIPKICVGRDTTHRLAELDNGAGIQALIGIGLDEERGEESSLEDTQQVIDVVGIARITQQLLHLW